MTFAQMKHEMYRRLFFAERARREQIRASIAMPSAAISFTVFAFSGLAQHFDMACWQEPSALAIILFAVLSVGSLLAAVVCAIGVEWMFVYHEPPDLGAMTTMEARLRSHPIENADGGGRPEVLDDRIHDLLAASYYIAYERYLSGNESSARRRGWALRFVMTALICLLACFMLLPVHLAGH